MQKTQNGNFLDNLIALLIIALSLKFCASWISNHENKEHKNNQISYNQIRNQHANLYTITALNVRELPQKDSKKLYTLPPKAKVEIIETKGNWSKISYQDKNRKIIGWVYNKYLTKTIKNKTQKKNFIFSILLKEGERPQKVIETSSGKYLIVGSINTNSFDSDGFIAFINKKGKILLRKNFNNGYVGYTEYFNSVVEATPGKFIAVGSAPHPFQRRSLDIWIVSFDNKGNKLWENFYDKDHLGDEGKGIIKLGKNSFLVFGYYATNPNDSAAVFKKINDKGKSIDELVYREYNYDIVPQYVVKLGKHSILSAGFWENYSSKDKNEKLWLAKISTDNKIKFIWNNKTSNHCDCKFIDNSISIVKEKNDFIVAVNTQKGRKSEIKIIKFNQQGKPIWEKIISSKNKNLIGSLIVKEHDGSFILGTNIVDQKFQKSKIYLIKLDKNGNIIKSKIINSKRYAEIKSILVTKTGNLLITALVENKGWIFEIKPL